MSIYTSGRVTIQYSLPRFTPNIQASNDTLVAGDNIRHLDPRLVPLSLPTLLFMTCRVFCPAAPELSPTSRTAAKEKAQPVMKYEIKSHSFIIRQRSMTVSIIIVVDGPGAECTCCTKRLSVTRVLLRAG